jgi:hypothetical protein
MICICRCYPTSAFGRLGRGPRTLSVVREFCFALIFSCYYTHSNWTISTGPRVISGLMGEENGRVSANDQKCRARGTHELSSGKITLLETAYADMKREKESITTSYQRLLDKHKMFTKNAE